MYANKMITCSHWRDESHTASEMQWKYEIREQISSEYNQHQVVLPMHECIFLVCWHLQMIIIRGECLKREAYKINDTPLMVQYFMELVKMRTTTNQQIVLSMQRTSHQYTSIVRMKNLFTTLGNNVNESKLPKWIEHLPFFFVLPFSSFSRFWPGQFIVISAHLRSWWVASIWCADMYQI